jgi:hypothetical protein
MSAANPRRRTATELDGLRILNEGLPPDFNQCLFER